jgi:hypothetical protein
MQPGRKVARSFFVVCCDTSIMLDGIEESLNEIALGVKYEVQVRLTLRFDFGGITTLMARTSKLPMKLSMNRPGFAGGHLV